MRPFLQAAREAFDQFDAQEACPSHVYGEPFTWEARTGSQRVIWHSVKCELCGRRVGRRSLAELREVIRGT